MKYVLDRVDEGKKSSGINQEVDIFKIIYWLKSAWKNVSTYSIKNCFQKYVLKDATVNPPKDHGIGEEFKGSFADSLLKRTFL